MLKGRRASVRSVRRVGFVDEARRYGCGPEKGKTLRWRRRAGEAQDCGAHPQPPFEEEDPTVPGESPKDARGEGKPMDLLLLGRNGLWSPGKPRERMTGAW
jgi:hypothetical protein